jgi:hypothetical protein
MARNPALLDLEEQRQALVPEADPPFVLPVPELPADEAPPPPAPPPGKPLDAYAPSAQYGEGADRAALEAAIAHRAKQDQAADFLDAASLFNRAGGGHAGDLAAPVRQHREDSFNDVMRRRALADQDAQAADRARKLALASASEDPGSELSQKALGFYGASTIGKEMLNRLPPEMRARLTASMVPGGKDILESETDLYKAGLKANAANKADGREDTLAALVAAAGGPDSLRGQWFAKTFANAPFQVIKDKGFELLNHEEQRKFQGSQNDLSRENATKNTLIGAGLAYDEKVRKGREEIGTALDKTGGFFSNARVVDEILAKYRGPDGKITSLPTVGPLAKPITDIGGGLLRSEDGQKLAKAADLIQLAIRNLVTGSAASTEEDRRIAAAGVDRRSLQGFLTGYDLIKRRYTDLLKRTYGTYDPVVAQGFIARNPEYGIPGDPVYDPKRARAAFIQAERTTLAGPAKSVALRRIQELGGVLSGASPPPVPTTTPVREPSGDPAPTETQGPVEQPVVKTFRNKVTGALQKFRVYPDGRKEPVDE